MSRIRYSLIGLLAAAAMAISASNAQAAFQIRLTSYTLGNVVNGTATFTDEVAGEGAFGVPGSLSLPSNFTLGTFQVIFSQGLSKPIYPTGPDAHMHLNSVQVSSLSAGGKLLIELTDTGWGATAPGTFTGAVGGTQQAGSTVAFNAYKSLTNLEFSQANLAASLGLGAFTATSYSGAVSTGHGAIGSPYSMTLTAFLVHNTALATSSFDFDVTNTAVPEPATVISAVLGLPMLLGYGLRRRKLAASSVA